MSIREYLKTQVTETHSTNEYTIFDDINISIINPFVHDIDFRQVLKTLEETLPAHLTYEVDSILVGDFDFLNDREIDASYLDGAIYVTNKQESPISMVDDIIHEFAHSVEKMASYEIYADGDLEREFLTKRNHLSKELTKEDYKVPLEVIFNPDFDEKFDLFLYRNVGYDKLAIMTVGIFVSPYGATSLKEYFANGFEHYFIGEREYIKDICPILYKKLKMLDEYSEKGDLDYA